MQNQNEHEMWEKILQDLDHYIIKLADCSEMSDKEFDELENIQKAIINSTDEFFKIYGLSKDRIEILRKKYTQSQQLLANTKNTIQQNVKKTINDSEGHIKYINAKNHQND